MTLALRLAARIHEVKGANLPDEAVGAARTAILDTVGVMLAGAAEPGPKLAADLIAPEDTLGQHVLFGHRRRSSALGAAEVNGIAAHALDFDCVADTMAGHPTVQIVPALLALAEMLDSDGAQFVSAFVAGLEMQARVARGITPSLGRSGWFTTSTLGTLGAAAACAHLMRLDVERTAHALALAAMLASGILANAATGAKALAAGHSARSGLQAALLARGGMTAALDALEHRQGFLAAFNATGRSDPEAMLSGWGKPFDIVEPGLWIKQYPCCGIAHAPVDLLTRLVAEHRLTTENVAAIEVLLHPQRVAHVDRPRPQTGTAAAFSIQYCLSRTLEGRPPELADFQGEAFRDPAVTASMARISVRADPAMDAASMRYGEQFGAVLHVTTRDGREFAARTDAPLGLGPANPLPDSTVEAKFVACAGQTLAAGPVDRLLEALRRIEQASSLRTVTAIAME